MLRGIVTLHEIKDREGWHYEIEEGKMTESEQREYDALKKDYEEMMKDCRMIADYADALKNVLAFVLDGVQENVIVELTLNEIIKLVERNS